MPPHQIVPQLGLASFSCPHCGAIAQQTWYRSYLVGFERKEKPEVIKYDLAIHVAIKERSSPSPEAAKEKKRLIEFLDRLEKHSVTYRTNEYSKSSTIELVNVALNHCYSCGGFGIWVQDELTFPQGEVAFVPHEEMPLTVRIDFDEAASIVVKSPRGAAALLRLCVQKLVKELGEPGVSLNDDIGSLVRKGKVSGAIQQALDVVRVVGNNAVHPGTINFDDDRTTATNLFGLVNLIVETAIAAPKHIQKMYENIVPESTKKAIEQRDAQPQSEPPK